MNDRQVISVIIMEGKKRKEKNRKNIDPSDGSGGAYLRIFDLLNSGLSGSVDEILSVIADISGADSLELWVRENDRFVLKGLAPQAPPEQAEKPADDAGPARCECDDILNDRPPPDGFQKTDRGTLWTDDCRGWTLKSGENPTGSLVCIPLRSGKALIGILQFRSRKNKVFDSGLVARCEQLSSAVAVAVARDLRDARHEKTGTMFRVLAEESPNMIFINSGGRILYVNRMCEELMGYRREEFLSADFNFLNLVSPEYRETTIRNLQSHMRGEEVAPFEYDVVRKDGSRLHAIISTRLIDYQGAPAILGIITDISKQKQAEKALKESEALFSSFMNHLPAAAFMKDADGRPLYLNRYMRDTFGIEEYRGKSTEDLYPKEAAERMILGDRNALAHGYAVTEETLADKEGKERVYQTHKFRIGDTDGPPIIGGFAFEITERKRAEEDLRISEIRFRTLWNSVEIGILLINMETHIIEDANQGAVNLFRADRSLMVGRECHRVICPAERGKCPITDLGMSVDKSVRTFLAADGTVIPVIKTVTRVALGGVEYLMESFFDITKQVEAERKLRESEEKYRILAENVSDLIWVMKLDATFLYISPSVERMLGYSPEESHDLSMDGFVAPESMGIIMDAMEEERAYLKSGREQSDRVFTLELKLVRKDGAAVWTESKISRLFDSNGRHIGLLGATRDITRRREAQKALEKSEGLYRGIVETIESGITIVERGAVAFISDRACEIFGSPRNECMEKTVFDFAAPEERERLMPARGGLLSGSDIPRELDFWIQRDDGGKRFIHNHYVLLDENQSRWLVVTEDVTGHKIAEDRIRASLREKDLLLKEIHHRVKNNMQVISSMLGLQSDYLKDQRDVELFLDCQNRVRAMALVHEKLYQSSDLSHINMEEYIRDLAGLLMSFYGSRHIGLSINAENIFLDINTAIPCAQIINELFSNALKYAFPDGRQGSIAISMTRMPDNRLELMFSDNGIGLPGGFSMDSSASLGLRLVSALVKGLGGAMRVESDGGAVFVLDF